MGREVGSIWEEMGYMKGYDQNILHENILNEKYIKFNGWSLNIYRIDFLGSRPPYSFHVMANFGCQLVMWHYFCGNVNKSPLTWERELVTDQRKDAAKVQIDEQWALLGYWQSGGDGYLRGLNDSKRVASPQPQPGMGGGSQILKTQSLMITHKQLRRVGSDSFRQLSWSLPFTLLLYRGGFLAPLLLACFFSAVLATYKILGREESSAPDQFQRAQR